MYVREYDFVDLDLRLSSGYSRVENEYYLRHLKRNYLVGYSVNEKCLGFYGDYTSNYDYFSDTTLAQRVEMHTDYLYTHKLMSVKLRPRLEKNFQQNQ